MSTETEEPKWIDELAKLVLVTRLCGEHKLEAELAGEVATLTLDWMAISKLELQPTADGKLKFDTKQVDEALPLISRMLVRSKNPAHAIIAATILAQVAMGDTKDEVGIVNLMKWVLKWVEARPNGREAFEVAKRKHANCRCDLHLSGVIGEGGEA